jgi:D-3-phosphoglycerate dehydrogenase
VIQWGGDFFLFGEKMFRVLLADKLPLSVVSRLESRGCEVIVSPDLKDDTLEQALRDHNPEVLVVRSTKVNSGHLDAASALSLVVRAGAGVNTIDLAAASSRGVYVSNCPGKNAVAVAELAWAHILNADRRVADGVHDLRSGQWRKKVYSKQAKGIKGRTLGIVGFGAIGQAVAKRGHAFEMEILAFDPALTPEAAEEWRVRSVESLVELASESDVLTVHVGLNAHTRGLIGNEVIQALKPGAIVVNTSRGPVVDEAALRRGIEEKGLRAGLDVFCEEPAADGSWKPDLVDLPGVYGTHHIGASTDEAQEAVAMEACRVLETYADEGSPANCVNLARYTPATHLLVIRHRDEVGVLSGVLNLLKEAKINVQNMENIVFSAEVGSPCAACARIQIVGSPEPPILESLMSGSAIFEVKLLSLEG